MKRYTLGALIHDAKIFNQLRSEYRRKQRNDRRKHASLGHLSRHLNLKIALRMIPRYARGLGSSQP